MTNLFFSSVVAFMLFFPAVYAQIPELGIASSLVSDSVIYSSGYRYIGESVSRMVSPNLSEQQFAANIELVKKAKCKVYMCNVFFPADLKIVGENVEEAKVLNYAETVFKRAQILGVPAIVLGSGGARKLEEGQDRAKAKKDFIALGRKMAALARQYGVKIFLENLNSGETNFINTVKEGADIVRQINHPNFKLNADIYHMLKEGELSQSILDAADVIEYVELAEKEGRTRPGVSQEDFVPYFKALCEIGYQGKIFIEGRWSNLSSEASLAKNYIEAQLKEAYIK